MAKKTKTAAAPAAAQVKVGSRLEFQGYDGLPDDMEPLFEKGDILIVDEIVKLKKGEEALPGVTKVKAYRETDTQKDEIDTVFVGTEATLLEDAPAAAPAKGKAAAPAKGKAKAAAKEEAAEEEGDDNLDGEEEAEGEEEEAEAEEEAAEAAPAPAKRGKAQRAEAPAKAKASVPARTKEEAESAEINHMASVKKIIKKGDMLEAAKNLVQQAEKSFFDLGGVLAEIQRSKAYMDAGFTKEKKIHGKPVSAFEQYINAELGLEYRKAMYLIDIYRTFSGLGVDENRLAQIGWTKLKLVARGLGPNATEKDLEKLLSLAERKTRDELEEHIKETKVGGKAGDKIKKVKYIMTAFGDEAEYISQAITRAQELVTGGDVNEAMKHIYREWATLVQNLEIPKAEAIKALETRYGVKLAEVADGDEPAAAPAPKASAKATKAAAKPATKPAAKGGVAKPEAKKAAPAKAKAAPAKGKKKAA